MMKRHSLRDTVALFTAKRKQCSPNEHTTQRRGVPPFFPYFPSLTISFATRDLALSTLCRACGNNRGLRLYGALCAYQDRHKDLAAKEIGIERQSFVRLLRDARKAGVNPAMVEGEPLPPLEIVWPPTTIHEGSVLTDGEFTY